MKKITLFLLAGVIALSLFSCTKADVEREPEPKEEQKENEQLQELPESEEKEYQVSQEQMDRIVGTWWDTDSQRCNIKVEKTEEVGIYQVEINWSSSAWENTKWTMTLEYLPGSSDIAGEYVYYDGKMYSEIWDENRESSATEEIYHDGYGSLSLVGEYLFWTDQIEHVRDDIPFEKVIQQLEE